MSFGFSVGDFLSAARLIQDVVTVLRSSAYSEYQELVLELHSLQRALNQIEHLKAPPEQETSVNSVKVAALMCTHVLDGFAKKLQKFEALAGRKRKDSRSALWKQKLRWGFTMEDEVRDVRAYLAAHVGSLNMRLVTEGISSTYLVAERSERNNAGLQRLSENIESRIIETDKKVSDSSGIIRTLQAAVAKIASTISGEVVPQLRTLTDQMRRIWQTNIQLTTLLIRMQDNPMPNLEYTWFQAPIKFEDALGRVIPIPSEFDWPKIEAIICVHFSNSPGYTKVMAGEYELFDPIDRTQVISRSTFSGLRPGMSITMAFLVGRYTDSLGEIRRCPRPGCGAGNIRDLVTGGRQCISCNVRFENAQTSLPLPYRDERFFSGRSDPPIDGRPMTKRKREAYHYRDLDRYEHSKKARMEKMAYKNLRISRTPLPATPAVRNIRRNKPKIHMGNGDLPKTSVTHESIRHSTAEALFMLGQAPEHRFKKPFIPGQPIAQPTASIENASFSSQNSLRFLNSQSPNPIELMLRAGFAMALPSNLPQPPKAPSSVSTYYASEPTTFRFTQAFSRPSTNTPSVFSES